MKYAPRKVYIKESGGYVELSYTDFCRRRQADKGYMDKLFIPVQGCLLEVVREQYADFYRDRERWRYLQKLDARNSLLSLDGFTDSEGNPLDFIADEAADIAETVVNAVMVDRLKAALPLLRQSAGGIPKLPSPPSPLSPKGQLPAEERKMMDYALCNPAFPETQSGRRCGLRTPQRA